MMLSNKSYQFDRIALIFPVAITAVTLKSNWRVHSLPSYLPLSLFGCYTNVSLVCLGVTDDKQGVYFYACICKPKLSGEPL